MEAHMRWSWKLGQIFGIGVYIHATFWLLILLVLYSSWAQGHTPARAAAGVLFVLAVFGCVVLHEFGHALTARRFGIRTKDITILPIGGLARLERMPDDPKQEIWVALAGPAVNVAIAAVLYLGLGTIGGRLAWTEFDWTGAKLLTDLLDVNIWLALFNLIPAFPMDGGRVLRAALATRMEYTRATEIAARTGQTIAFLFGLIGLFGNPFLMFIALFVWLGAEQEAATVQMRSSITGIPVQRVMVTNFQTLAPDEPVGKAVEYFLAGSQQEFPVLSENAMIGVVTRDDLVSAIRASGAAVPVRDVMQPGAIPVDSHEMLDSVVSRFHNSKGRALPVVHHGRLVGMLTMENIAKFLMVQTAAMGRRPSAQRM
jgi:Zn-dependent protease/CBS domain-containing protein